MSHSATKDNRLNIRCDERTRQLLGQLLLASTHEKALKTLRQADYLRLQYHVVIANPPYMGSKGIHLGARAFDSIGGELVSTTAFVLENNHKPAYKGAYIRLVDGNSEEEKSVMLMGAIR